MILVLGGNGQLGRELARMASIRGVSFAALSRGDLDIAESSAVTRALAVYKPTLVVNAAGYTKVDLAETNVEQACRGNELGPAVLAQACAAADLPLLHVSTDYVFDGTKNGTYLESDPISPINVYGRTKAAGEKAVRQTLPRHIILRTAWVYSEFGHNFLKTIVRLARSRDELHIVADQKGNPTSTGQLADAILRIAPDLSNRSAWGTYHFTGAGVTTWHDFAAHIVSVVARLTGHDAKVTPISSAKYPTAARRPANSTLDNSRFAQVFGFCAGPWSEEAEAVTRAVVSSQRAGQ